MPRPTTKSDLIATANEQFDNLWKLIESMTAEEQNAEFQFEDRELHFEPQDWAVKKIKKQIKALK